MSRIAGSERLELRELEISDIWNLFVIISDPETMQYYPRPYSFRETEGWINRAITSYRANGFGLWGIILREEKIFVGQCGISLQNINGRILPEIGYHINKRYWKKGVASEAAKLCLEYAFSNLALNEIFIQTYIKNIPSIKVAERIGMKKTCVYDKKMRNLNITMKHVVYSKRKHVTTVARSQ